MFKRFLGWISDAHTVKTIRKQPGLTLRVESLEDRMAPAVTPTLLNGLLDIRFSDHNDSANVAVVGGNIRVSSDGIDRDFAASSVTSVLAHSTGGSNQSVTFAAGLHLSSDLTVEHLSQVTIKSGLFTAHSFSVNSVGSIELTNAQLNATGDIHLIAQVDITDPSAGLLGVHADGNASIKVNDSVIHADGSITFTAGVTINATAANDDQEDTNRDLARIVSEASALTFIGGLSEIVAGGDVTINATITQKLTAEANAKSTSTDAGRDAAVALINVTADALAHVSESAEISARGSFLLNATHIANLIATADGTAGGSAAKGGSVAIITFDANVRALVDGSAAIEAVAIDIGATSVNNLTTTAKATTGGATSNDDETQDELADSNAETSDGGITIAGAFAFNNIRGAETLASVAGNATLISDTVVNVRALHSGDIAATADAGATDGSVGFGVAVAINKGAIHHESSLADSPTIAAQSLNVEATMPTGRGIDAVRNVDAVATSGAGASNVGVAGAFAANLLDTNAHAMIKPDATVRAPDVDVNISARNKTSVNAEAKPFGAGATGDKFGIGASVALNKQANITAAEIGNRGDLEGAHDLTLAAVAAHTTTTSATIGAEGGIAATPGAALSVTDNRTRAVVAAGGELSLSGALAASATHASEVTTTAKGDAIGETAAIGATLALTDLSDEVIATTERDLRTDRNATFSVASRSKSLSSATASAAGATTGDAEEQIGDQQEAAGSDAEAPPAETPEGKIGLAAALGVNLTSNTSRAFVSGVRLDIGGQLTLDAVNETDAAAKADGSSVGEAALGVGVGVAINKAKTTNQALIGAGSDITAQGVIVQAGMPADGAANEFNAESIAGAGSSKVGIAGSLAINIVDNLSEAVYASGAQITSPGADVSFAATNVSSSATSALPNEIGASGDKLGFGASVAVTAIDNITRAEAEVGAVLHGATATTPFARDLSFSATSNHTSATEAKGGASAQGEGGGTAITPVVAISVVNNKTSANVPATIADPVNVSGDLSLSATNTSAVTSRAEGSADASKAAVGIALAWSSGTDDVSATFTGKAIAGDAVSLSATSDAARTAEAKASAKGGETAAQKEPGDEAEDVDVKVADVKTHADDVSGEESEDPPSAKTPEGKLAFAGAVAINLVKSNSTAALTSGAAIDAGGAVSIQSALDTDATAKADGSAVAAEGTPGSEEDEQDPGSTGVGVAVAVNKVTATNLATTGRNANIKSQGLIVQTQMPAEGEADSVSTISADAIAGAGSKKVGLAGSLALNIVDNTSTATVEQSTTVNAGNGDVLIAAESKSDVTTKALPSEGGAVGGTLGFGASVAVSAVDNITLAAIENGASIRGTGANGVGANNVTIRAVAEHAVHTTAQGGAGAASDEGGTAITPVFAIAVVDHTTSAHVSDVNLAGDLTVEASHIGTSETKAEGAADATETAVGIVVAWDSGKDQVTTTTNGRLTVGDAVTLSATSTSLRFCEAKASAKGGETTTENPEEDVDAKAAEVKAHADEVSSKDTEDAPSAETPDGKLAFAGALAISLVQSATQAVISDFTQVRSGGQVNVTSRNDASAKAKADASAVAGGSGGDDDEDEAGSSGVGIGIAINKASVTNTAFVGADATVQSAGLSVQALMKDGGDNPTANRFTAEASSGAGAAKVGVAGSLAINLVNNKTEALAKSGSVIDINTGDIVLSAANRSATTTSALPNETGVAGGTKGFGASVAVNVVDNITRAEVEAGATLNRDPNVPIVGNVTVQATGDHTSVTEAKGGAAATGPAGQFAITPVIAISVVENTTTAKIHDVALTGDLNVQTATTASTTTKAEGSAEANATAVGIALAFSSSNDVSNASIDGTIHAGGDVNVIASSLSASAVEAKASAKGGETEPAEAGEDVDAKIDKVKDHADEVSDKDNPDAPDAKTPDGSISVAGALAINLARSTTAARILPSAEVIASGDITVASISGMTASAKADGSAVVGVPEGETSDDETGSTGVGIAVALNVATSVNEASIGKSAVVAGEKITVSTKNPSPVRFPVPDLFGAEAISGAGAKKVGVAGSLALNIVNSKSDAVIVGDADVTHGFAGVSVAASDLSQSSAIARPAESGVNGGEVGVGASVAIHVVNNDTRAEIESGALLHGTASELFTDNPVSVGANASHTTLTEAFGGTGAEEEPGQVSVTPVIAITVADNNTIARVSSPSEGTLTIAGPLSIVASTTGTTTSHAEGATNAAETAIGASLALNIALDETIASIAGDIDVAGDVQLLAAGGSFSEAQAIASVKGGQKNEDAEVEDKDVDAELDKLSEHATEVSGKETPERPKAETPDGAVSVAGAVALNIHVSKAHALIEADARVHATDSIDLTAAMNGTGTARADGSAVATVNEEDANPEGTGVGAAVAVNVATMHALATIESGANVESQGVGLTAQGSNRSFTSEAIAGAGAKDVGVAGALALNVGVNKSEAVIPTGATVNAGIGASEITATNVSTSTVNAEATAAGGNVGVGASVAVNVARNRARAEIEAGAILHGDTRTSPSTGDLSVSATGSHEVSTTALGGAGRIPDGSATTAVTPVIAVTVANNDTIARVNISQGEPVIVNGHLTLNASHDAQTNTTATGSADGEGTAVGAALAVNVALDDAVAEVAGNVQSSGRVDINVTSRTDADAAAVASAKGGETNEPAGAADAKIGNIKDHAAEVSGEAIPASPSAKSPEGPQSTLSVAGALAVNIHVGGAHALLADNANVNAGGLVSLVSRAQNDASALADGSAVAAGSSGDSTGVGAAAAINIATVTNEAVVGSGAIVNSQGLNAKALSITLAGVPQASEYRADATSGAGSKQVGVAGALAINVANSHTDAVIESGARVNAGGGDVNVLSQVTTNNQANAQPLAFGGDTGVGASIAVNVANHDVRSELETNARLLGATSISSGAADLTVSATSANTAATTVTGGAGAGESGTAVTPIIGVTIADNDTTAKITGSVAGIAVPVRTSGSIHLTANATNSTTTHVEGLATAGATAVGAALAVNIASDNVEATMAGNVNAGTFIAQNATARSISSADAKASAMGGETTGSAGAIDAKLNALKGSLGDLSDSAIPNAPALQTPEGDAISVAGALAVNIHVANNRASVAPDANINALGGNHTIVARNQTDADASADGSAVAAGANSSTGVGAAAALNVATVHNEAIIETGAKTNSTGLTLQASMESSDDAVSSFGASAVSGAGSKDVGVAGALAINVSTNKNEALLRSGAHANAKTGAAVLTTSAASSALVEASPSVVAGRSGVGASLGINVAVNDVRSEIEAGARLHGATPAQTGANSLNVSATSNHVVDTTVTGGAGATNVAVTPVIGVTIASNETIAKVTGQVAGVTDAPIHVAGLTISAAHEGTTTTTVTGAATAGGPAVGAAMAVNIAVDDVAATTAGPIQTGSTVTITSSAMTDASAHAVASAKGGQANGAAGAVDDKINQLKGHLGGLSNETLPATPSARTPDNELSVAGALAVNVQVTHARSAIENGTLNQTGGLLKLQSFTDADSTAHANATAVTGGSGNGNGVGAAVAVNVATVKTEAEIGASAATTSRGVILDAKMSNLDDGKHTSTAEAFSGAGASGVGVAGSLGLNVFTNTSRAAINDNAIVDAGIGTATDDVTVTAQSSIDSDASAKPKITTGGSTGVGAGVAVDVNVNTVQAVLDSNATLRDAGDVSFIATLAESAAATVEGGAQGGTAVTPVAAITISVNKAEATVASGPALSHAGNLAINSSITGIDESSAIAQATGSGTAVGASLGLTVSKNDAIASLDRDVNASGSVTVSATTDVTSNVTSIGGARGALPTASGGSAATPTSDNLADQAANYANSFVARAVDSSPKGEFNSAINDAKAKLSSESKSTADGIGVAAALGVNIAVHSATANIAANRTLNAGGKLSVIAVNDLDAETKAQGVAVSGDGAVGAAAALTIAKPVAEATIGNDVHADVGDLEVRATSGVHRIRTEALAGAGGVQQSGRAGSIAVGITLDETKASVGTGATITSDAGAAIVADHDLDFQTVAGAAGAGFTSGVGVSFAVNVVTDTTEATLGANSSLDTFGETQIKADSNLGPVSGVLPGNPTTLAVSGALSAATAGAGAVAVDIVVQDVHATIGANAQVNRTNAPDASNQSVAVEAISNVELNDGTGSLTLGASNGVGGNLTVTVLVEDVQASIASSADVKALGTVSINATSIQDVLVAAAAASVAGQTAFAGAGSVYVQNTATRAAIAPNVNIDAGNVAVVASKDSTIDTLAGGAAVGVNTAVGGGVAVTVVTDTTEAVVRDADIIVHGVAGAAFQGLKVEANSIERVKPIAVGGTGAGTTAVAGSAIATIINETTTAHIDEGATIDASTGATSALHPSVTVAASDSTFVTDVAGSVGLGGGAGVAASADAQVITKNTNAFIASNVTINADQDVKITATSVEDIASVVVGGSGSLGLAISGQAGVIVLNATTRAVLGDDPTDNIAPAGVTSINAKGSVVVASADTTEIDALAGSVTVAAGAGIGAAASVPVIHKTTEAYVANGAHVVGEGRADRAGVTIASGTFNVSFGADDDNDDEDRSQDEVHAFKPNGSDVDGDNGNDLADDSFRKSRNVLAGTTSGFKGVAVTANNQDSIESFSISGGASGGVAVNVAAPVSVIDISTRAFVGTNATINATGTPGANQTVKVAAANDFQQMALGGVVGLAGAVTVTPGGTVSVIDLETTASIGNGANVRAAKDVVVQAVAEQDLLEIAAGLAGAGVVGVAGSINVIVLDSTTHAIIGDATVNTGGSVVVSATDNTDIDVVAGAVGVGFGVLGVGASVNVVDIDKDTLAEIQTGATVTALATASSDVAGVLDGEIVGNDFTTKTSRGVVVQATSKEDVVALSVAGGGGLLAAAGAVLGTVLDSDTTAVIRDADVTVGPTSFTGNQGVHVSAANEVNVKTLAVGASIGGGSLTGAVDIGVIRNDVQALIDTNATVQSSGDVEVNALALKNIDGLALSAGAGFVALGASVSVWSIGTPFDSQFSDDEGGGSANALNGDDEDSQTPDDTVDGFASSRVASAHQNITGNLGGYAAPVGSPTTNLSPQDRVGLAMRTGRTSTTDTFDDKGLDESFAKNSLRNSSPQTGVDASIGAGATITAARDVSVRAEEGLSVEVLTGGVVAGLLAVGGAVTVINVNSDVDATIAGTVSAGDDVLVRADSRNEVDATSLAGQAGRITLGAAVVVVNDHSTQSALLASTANVISADDVRIEANEFQTLKANSNQAAGSFVVAIGASFSKITTDGTTEALVDDNADVGTTSGASVDSLTVLAHTDLSVDAQARGLARGIGAGTANFAKAIVNPMVIAKIDNSAQVDVDGNVLVRAISEAGARARTTGRNSGGLAIGYSKSDATITPSVTAAIEGANTHVTAGGNIDVDAYHNVPAPDQAAPPPPPTRTGGAISLPGIRIPSIVNTNIGLDITDGIAGGGLIGDLINPDLIDIATGRVAKGAFAEAESSTDGTKRKKDEGDGLSLLAGNGGVANATSSANVRATIESGVEIDVVGTLTVKTASHNVADALGGALSATLIGGLGGVRTTATIRGQSHAVLGHLSTANAAHTDVSAGALVIDALSDDRAEAESEASAGGIVFAGTINSATASIAPSSSTTPNARASVGTNVHIDLIGDASIGATGTSDADASSKGVDAGDSDSAVGIGLSRATSTASPLIDVSIGAGSQLNAGGDIVIEGRHGFSTPTSLNVAGFFGVANDDISTALAQGSVGTFFGGGQGSDATINFKPQINVNVNADAISGAEVVIESLAFGAGAARAINDVDGFFVARGNSQTFATLNAQTKATLGTADVTADNFTLRATSSQIGDAFGNARSKGGFPNAIAETDTLIDHETMAIVNGATINAVGDLTVESFARTRATAGANGNSGGIDSDGHATASATVGELVDSTRTQESTPRALAKTEINAGTSLTAMRVHLLATQAQADAVAVVATRNGGGLGDPFATANASVISDAVLTIDGTVDITAPELVEIRARHSGPLATDGVDTVANSRSIVAAALGSGTATSNALSLTQSLVTANDGAHISTSNLQVQTNTDLNQNTAIAVRDEQVRELEGNENVSTSAVRVITWNADVELLTGLDPVLRVVQNGNTAQVVEATGGVLINDSDGSNGVGPVAASSITVLPLNNTALGTILFSGGADFTTDGNGAISQITGSTGTVTIRHTWDSITIHNGSEKDLLLGAINPVASAAPTATIDVENDANFDFDIFHDYRPTVIDIRSNGTTGDADVVFTGAINNPVGQTNVSATRGDIRSTATGLIRTNELTLDAHLSIGTPAQKLAVELVQSTNQAVELDATAGSNVRLDLKPILRQSVSTGSLVTLDLANVTAGNVIDITLRDMVTQTANPGVEAGLRVNEIEQGVNTTYDNHFKPDAGADQARPVAFFGTGSTTRSVAYDFGNLTAGGAVNLVSVATTSTVNATAVGAIGGQFDASISGDLDVTVSGGLAVGAVTSTTGDVILNASNGNVTDALNDAAADVTGDFVAIFAANGNIGASNNALDVNSNLFRASLGGDAFVTETAGNMNVDQINAAGNAIVLNVPNGSILDGAGSLATDFIASTVTLTANGSVGTSADELEIFVGDITASAGSGGIFLNQVSGRVTILNAITATGDIRLTSTDTNTANNPDDIVLAANASVTTGNGQITIRTGDDFEMNAGSLISANLGVAIVGDFGDVDAAGAGINLKGTINGHPITVTTGNDNDSVFLDGVLLQGPITIQTGDGDDQLTVHNLPTMTTSTSGVRDRVRLEGQGGVDAYNVNFHGSSDYIVNIAGLGASDASGETININGTANADAITLRNGVVEVNHAGTKEQVTHSGVNARLTLNGQAGNDTIAIDTATGALALSGGYALAGGAGTDAITFTGSAQADRFEWEGLTADSARLKAKTPNTAVEAVLDLTTVETVSVNGAAPTTNPGDHLHVVNQLTGVLPKPNGTVATALPLVYQNIESVSVHSQPVAVNNSVSVNEDTTSANIPIFANDTGIDDGPFTVTFSTPTNGTVSYSNNGTPSNLLDDVVTYRGAANFAGSDSFTYTVTDTNGEFATATVLVTVNAVADAPNLTVPVTLGGDENAPIPMGITSSLVDGDGSETLSITIAGVPATATLSAGTRNALTGVWTLTSAQLRNLTITVPDDGNFVLTVTATARETSNGNQASTIRTVALRVNNVAPTGLIDAPRQGIVGVASTFLLRADDVSPIDMAGEFTWTINWGDGSPLGIGTLAAGTSHEPLLRTHTYAQAGTYVITVIWTDKDGASGPPVTLLFNVVGAELRTNPTTGLQDLIVTGTNNNDEIRIDRQGQDRVKVIVNGENLGTFEPTGRIEVYGLDGNDDIELKNGVRQDAWLFGGNGNDELRGGKGSNVLLGGDGDDELFGAGGRDLLIGGLGNDKLKGGDGEDILIGGTTAFDNDPSAIAAIMAEWNSSRDYNKRVANLSGNGTGPRLNGNTFLFASGSDATVFDDFAVDELKGGDDKDWLFHPPQEDCPDGDDD